MLKADISYKNFVPEVSKEIGNFVNRAVEKSLLVLEGNIKLNTPVKEGTLRRSITPKMTGFGQGQVYTAPLEGGKEVNYAVYVEYGTRSMAPRAMFRKGVAQSDDRIKEIFKDEAGKVVTSVVK